MNPHHIRKQTIQSNFKNLITNVPKPITEIHYTKKIDSDNMVTPIINNHVLFEFTEKKKEPEPVIENENVVEYIVDTGVDLREIYQTENESLEYNPMFFSLRRFIPPTEDK